MSGYRMLRPDGTSCSMEEIAGILVRWILSDPGSHYELTVGTDSQNFDRTRMVEAVVAHRKGSGGIFFYYIEDVRPIRDLRVKIYEETQRSLSLGGRLMEELRKALADAELDIGSLDIHVAIHCDVGRNGSTRALIQEIAGWVEGQGYECRIKPESYAASTIANRYSK